LLTFPLCYSIYFTFFVIIVSLISFSMPPSDYTVRDKIKTTYGFDLTVLLVILAIQGVPKIRRKLCTNRKISIKVTTQFEKKSIPIEK
jgi:hypothetical protein